MLITVTGCKSGQPITTTVNYAQEGQTVWVTSFCNRNWWRNLRTGCPVVLLIKSQEVQGWERVIEDRPEVEAALADICSVSPRLPDISM